MASPLCLRRPTLRVLCVRARLARSILAQVAKRVPVDVVMPDGSHLGGGTRRTDRPGLEIVRPTAVFERLAHHPKIGIGETWISSAPGYWGRICAPPPTVMIQSRWGSFESLWAPAGVDRTASRRAAAGATLAIVGRIFSLIVLPS